MPESENVSPQKIPNLTTVKGNDLKSFDDLEVEHQQKLVTLNKASTEKRSHDDLDILTQEKIKDFIPSNEVKIIESSLKSLEELELQKVKPKSTIRRFFSSIKNSIGNAWDWFSNTRIGKVVLSSSVSRIFSLTLATVTIAGFFTPAAPISIVLAALSIATVGVSAIIDTLKTRNLRKLERENTLLVSNRNNKSKQDYLLNLNPELAIILEKQLYCPILKENTTKDRYYVAPKLALAMAAGRTLANNVDGIAAVTSDIAVIFGSAVVATVAMSPVAILGVIKNGGSLGLSLLSIGLIEKQFKNLDLEFKLHINEEYIKKDTPQYTNIKELQAACAKQQSQSTALVKLITEPDYWQISQNSEKLIKRFNEINSELALEQKTFEQKNSNFVVKFINKIKSFSKDVGRAHYPFYNQPSQVSKHIALTDAVIKDNIMRKDASEISNKLKNKSYILPLKSEQIDITGINVKLPQATSINAKATRQL